MSYETMQLSKGTQSSLSEINMVPFVDVVLVLLIIFMITAPILQSGIEVDVPKTKTVKDISQDRIVVSIDKSQRVYLGNDPVNIHELGAKVHAQLKNTQRSVFLRCDEKVPFGIFASVVDTLRISGINNISIVTEPLTERARTK
ncbi:MAG TPA: biopolymer transporter ExbD [Candidatus Dormibacteraeota bacterium]|nr:biopolymer transporter ExbD [Candidatus Dormibacteraeota bacterium]